jgi:hypothetical protein
VRPDEAGAAGHQDVMPVLRSSTRPA